MAHKNEELWRRVFAALHNQDQTVPEYDSVQILEDGADMDCYPEVSVRCLILLPDGSKKVVFAKWDSSWDEIDDVRCEAA